MIENDFATINLLIELTRGLHPESTLESSAIKAWLQVFLKSEDFSEIVASLTEGHNDETPTIGAKLDEARISKTEGNLFATIKLTLLGEKATLQIRVSASNKGKNAVTMYTRPTEIAALSNPDDWVVFLLAVLLSWPRNP